jgi:ERCC4-type nuclease
MTRILVPTDPVKERKRLLDQARHCRDLANSYDDARLKEELSAIEKSYEANASLVVDGGFVRRQMHDGSPFPQQMQRLSGSACSD